MDNNPAKLQSRARLSRLAWLPIPILLLTMLALWATHLQGSYGSASLIMALNLIFSMLTSLLIIFLISRSFLTRGAPGLLMLGCGVLTWGAAGVVAKVVIQGDANADVTIHNVCVWISALFHFGSALLLLRPRRAVQARELWLGVAYAVTVGLLTLVALAVLHGWTPVFFVQGAGGTAVRQFVLGSAIAMFLFTAGLLKGANRRSLPAFLYWYTLALGLIAVGLFGIMIESVFASLLSWAGLAAQYLSGVYMLIAAIASVRASGAWQISLEAALRESQDALRQSEERLRLLVDGTQACALFMLDPQGRISTWNGGGRRLKGYEAEEVIGRHFSIFYTPEDMAAGKPARELETAQREGKYEEEGQRVRKDGSRFWASVLISPLRDAQGRLRGFSKLIRDISERERAEEALRESRERLDLALVSSGMAKFDWDIVKNKRTWSEGVHGLLGTKPETFTGTADEFFEAIHPEDRTAVRAALARAVETTSQYEAEYRAVWPDGSIHHISARGKVHRDSAGQAVRMSGVCWDITERKRAEEALRESERFIKSVAEASPHWFYVFDLDSMGLSYSNRPILRDLGYPPEVHTTVTRLDAFRAYMPPEEMPHLARLIEEWRTLPDGLVRDDEYRLRHADGTLHYFAGRETVFARGSDGTVQRILGSLLDITERKRAEETLRESEVRYRTLFNTIDAGFCIIEMVFDSEGKPVDYRLLEINEAFEKQTGLHAAQGKLMRELVPAHETHWFETYGAIALTGEARHFVNEARQLNRWYDVYAYRVGAPEARQVAILFNDITAHKQAETEIRRRAEELRAANDELTRFNRVTVGRELRIIELKKQVNDLCAQLGQPPRYATELDEEARPAQ